MPVAWHSLFIIAHPMESASKIINPKIRQNINFVQSSLFFILL